MKTRTFRRLGRRSSALVTTLLVVLVLSIIVVAFMQSMAIERAVARSVANKYQADLAAEAALELFMQTLGTTVTSNRFYIVAITNISANTNVAPLLLLRQNNPTTLSNTIPLASGNIVQFLANRTNPGALATFITNLVSTDRSVALDLNRLRTEDSPFVNSYDTNLRYLAAWNYLTNAAGTNIARFAYVATDEQGKINLAVSRGNSSASRITESIVNGFDIPVAGTNAPFMLAEEDLTRLQSYAAAPGFGHGGIGQAFSNYAEYKKRKPFYSFLTEASAPEEEFIPTGYLNESTNFVAYPSAGQPKFNLNNLATNSTYGGSATARATNIAAIIDSNLPLYKRRDPSFAVNGDIRYIRRLAASIVDYVDTDSTTTHIPDSGAITEPAGTELQGAVFGIMERYRWTAERPVTGGYEVDVLHSLYVQVWNPYQTNVSGTLNLAVESFRPVEIPEALDAPLPTLGGSVSVSVRPNEIRAYKVTEATRTFFTPSADAPSSAPANYPKLAQTGYQANRPAQSRFKAQWDGVLSSWTANESSLFDERGPGLDKAEATLTLGGNSWSANLLQHNRVDPKGYRSVADPRQAFSQNYVWLHRAVTGEFRVNGRSLFAITGNSTGHDFSTMWLGRDYMPFSPLTGSTMTTAQEPHTRPIPYDSNVSTESRRFPSVIRNAAMESIGELGHIYDSANVNEIGIAANGGNPAAWFISGGGRTLRIGQPEFSFHQSVSLSGSERRATNWNSAGIRSQHLLDLFTVAATNSAGVPSRIPRININTARKEVLQSIFLNMRPITDPTYTNSVINITHAASIADTIISNRPYINYSDFHKFLPALTHPTNYTPALGPASFTHPAWLDMGNSPYTPVMVADRAAEEAFRRSVESLGIHSHCFRVFIVGEAIGRNNKPVATSRLEVLLYLRQVSAGGNNYRISPQVIYRKQLD